MNTQAVTSPQIEPAARETVIAPSSNQRRWFSLRDLWDYRDLLLLLARRDVSVRYRQAALGMAWAVLQPLGHMLILWLIFGRLVRLPSDGIPYPLFVFAALLPWQFFSSALNASGNSVISNPNLITKVYFPRLVIPVAALGAPAVDLAVATGLMFVLMLSYGQPIGVGVLALPFLFALAAMIAIGVGSFVAAATVSYRDFRHLMPFLTTSWYWLTPVIYPIALVPEKWQPLLYLNPMTGVVDGIRAAWFGRPPDWNAMAASIVWGIVLLWAGITYFRRVERRFADVV